MYMYVYNMFRFVVSITVRFRYLTPNLAAVVLVAATLGRMPHGTSESAASSQPGLLSSHARQGHGATGPGHGRQLAGRLVGAALHGALLF